MKTIYQPPLPFLGSKRNFVKQFIKLLLETEYKGIITKDTIFLDVFGGSGVLAHNIKMNFPKNRVIWNDFDNYQVRLDNLENTQALLEKIFASITIRNGFRIIDSDRKKIIELIENEQKRGYVDFISVSSFLLFQGNYEKNLDDLKKHAWYIKDNGIKKRSGEGYLNGVERISCDFVEAIKSFSGNNVFSIYDPPYLFSNEKAYNDKWNMKNFLTLLAILKPPFVLFSHDRSGILDFMECFSGFENIRIIARETILTSTSKYGEYMVFQDNCPPPPPTTSKERTFILKL